MAVLNITYNGLSADYPLDVDMNLTDGDVVVRARWCYKRLPDRRARVRTDRRRRGSLVGE